MPFSIPQHVQTLKPYVPGKPIEETEREYGITGAIKLASNENPLGPSPKALQALAEGLSQMHLYPDASSFYLRQKLAAKLGVGMEELVFGSGSNEIIELLIRTFMSETDEAVVSRGTFVMYKVALHAHNRRFVEVPDKNHYYDLEAMARAIGPNTRLVFLANPDNPAGTWFERPAFEKFLQEATKRNPDALLIMDEAYFEYVTAPGYPDSLKYRKDYPSIVTLRTFSKIYGLAGLRIGYGVMHPTLVGYLDRTRMPFNVSYAAQLAAMGALDDVEHLERTREVNRVGKELLTRELTALGLEVWPTQANFVFVDFKQPAAPLNEALLRKGVIVRPVANYGFPTILRITIGTQAENAKFLSAIREILSAK